MSDFQRFFESLTPISPESWSRFSSLFKPATLRKGAYFILEDQLATDIAFLESGVVRAFYRNTEGVEYNKHFFVNPCFIGAYASLITRLPNKINQQALTDCTLQVAKYSDIQSLYADCPDIERANRILAELFFVQKEQKEIEIVLLDAEKRYEIFRQTYPQLEQVIPQYQVASFLGITPTQLSRIRRKMTGK